MQKNENNISLGIDLGLANLGFSIIKDKKLISYGIILTNKKDEHKKRLEIIYKELEIIINFYNPKIVLVENIFHGRNHKTFINISNVQGIVFLLISKKKLHHQDIHPNKVKRQITNKNKAGKEEILEIIKKRFSIYDNIIDDIADAIAINLCQENI